MTARYFDPVVFGKSWVEAWSRGDLDDILSHYRDDATFTSPRALEVTGSAQIVGKPALRDYWTRSLEASGGVHFEYDTVAWDPDRRILVIIYFSRRGPGTARRRAMEASWFDESGFITAGDATYGADI